MLLKLPPVEIPSNLGHHADWAATLARATEVMSDVWEADAENYRIVWRLDDKSNTPGFVLEISDGQHAATRSFTLDELKDSRFLRRELMLLQSALWRQSTDQHLANLREILETFDENE